jgi:nucleoside-diphosphate-sugar epimerase
MRVLFIGGTGIISSACSRLARERGMELTLLNRGETRRDVPAGAEVLRADAYDPAAVAAALGDRTFDAVVNWIAYVPENVEADIRAFRGRTGQYVFISSASVYHKPPQHLPITEGTPLANPFWEYARNKIACEERLMRAYREEGFPITIVRPSHTYDRTLLPMHGGYTVVDRMRRGQEVIVHGDGTSLWVLTHHQDFARGFVGLLGHPLAIGDAFHITSDEVLTWNQIFATVARAAGAEARIVHVPSDWIARLDPDLGASLLGDKAHSVIFDNSKIRRLVPDFSATIPFASGAREIMAWYDEDPARQRVDERLNATFDRILAASRAAAASA